MKRLRYRVSGLIKVFTPVCVDDLPRAALFETSFVFIRINYDPPSTVLGVDLFPVFVFCSVHEIELIWETYDVAAFPLHICHRGFFSETLPEVQHVPITLSKTINFYNHTKVPATVHL